MGESNDTNLGLVQAAEKVLKKLSEEIGGNLLAAYIYGSVARGNCRESSDVDLHIVVKDYIINMKTPQLRYI